MGCVWILDLGGDLCRERKWEEKCEWNTSWCYFTFPFLFPQQITDQIHDPNTALKLFSIGDYISFAFTNAHIGLYDPRTTAESHFKPEHFMDWLWTPLSFQNKVMEVSQVVHHLWAPLSIHLFYYIKHTINLVWAPMSHIFSCPNSHLCNCEVSYFNFFLLHLHLNFFFHKTVTTVFYFCPRIHLCAQLLVYIVICMISCFF